MNHYFDIKINGFRNYMLITVLAVFIWNCQGQQASRGETKMMELTDSAYEDVVYELGTLVVGQEQEVVLTLTNKTPKPVLINNVRVFCGCTMPEYQTEPILPEASSDLKIRFVADSPGLFNKAVRVYLSNQDDPFDVQFTGEITQTL
ncbi:DUF1573 domain-containing protein [uncultured Sunxiuqinia sp.]|uniref:DUF1573 domain-containing protein n=1 Tax=Sunxiuqinia rutila TaxID=1397841 RepID=UPI002639FAD5|nr:DUF1573 domain-containing protein [uncultured Sunxiuqinia sp.]